MLKREQLAVIMCDVDYFKRYNDTYLYQAGDYCLRQVTQALQCSIRRSTDLVARYEGEEFAVILPNTSTEGAIHVAQIIQQEVKQLEIIHHSSEVSRYLILSIGVASVVPSQNLSREVLIAAAEKGLYEAKREGRNIIVKSDIL